MITVQQNFPKNYRHELTHFRALQAGPDFSKDDIITLNEQINQNNEQSETVVWKNKTTGFVLNSVPVIGIDVELIENARIKLTSEKLTIKSNSSHSFNNVPNDANFAQVHVIGGDIIYTLDGKTLPVEIGIRKKDWDTFSLEGRDEILKFQVAPLSNSKNNITLYCEYSQIIKD